MTTSQLRIQRVAPILDLLDRMGLKDRAGDLEDLILAYQESIAFGIHMESAVHSAMKNSEQNRLSRTTPGYDWMRGLVSIPGYPMYEFQYCLGEGRDRLSHVQKRMDANVFKRFLLDQVKTAVGINAGLLVSAVKDAPCPDYSKALK